MKPSYSCRPSLYGNTEKILCIGLLILSFSSFFLSSVFAALRAPIQLLSVVLLLLLIQITTKCHLTEYVYVLEDGVLYLSSVQGKREKKLGGIRLDDRCILLTEKEWEKGKKSYAISIRFAQCKNLFPKNAYYLLAPDAKGFVVLRFEPDEMLVSLLLQAIGAKK